MSSEFSDEQKEYLQGFVAGSQFGLARMGLPSFRVGGAEGSAASPGDVVTTSAKAESVHRAAQDAVIASGGKLCAEEQAKRDKHPFEMWDEIVANAAASKFPKGTDVFLYKFHGLFYAAPAQNAFMTRLRFPGGTCTSWQLEGLADLADRCGAGHCDITTRSNLQIREIGAQHAVDVITTLQDLGIMNRGSGADNIRNITASPTAGIDPGELYDTRRLCQQMQHYIYQHREMYGLPRKFNIAFDGGGVISALADTNDIGFMAVTKQADPSTVYFRMELGGITGHLDFARDCGILLRPEECVEAAGAVLKVFSEEGDRTDRKKARLKYVLDRLGFDVFLARVEAKWGKTFQKVPLEECNVRQPEQRLAHVGVHPQKQEGLSYVGVVLPVGRLTTQQMRALAKVSVQFGSGTIRLTPWQNLLLPDIQNDNVAKVCKLVENCGLHWSSSNVRAGLIACTGAAGCKFAAAHTKQHALQIANYLDASGIEMDSPVNIHLTGCHHSCAQHYIGDLGMIATKISRGDDMVEGYHIFVGGGYGEERGIARSLVRDLPAEEAPMFVKSILENYLAHRTGPSETFRAYSRRVEVAELVAHVEAVAAQS